MTEPRLLTLKCPNCGANLGIAPDMTQFACGYCGTEQVVQRRGGTVSLKPVTDAIEKVQAGTDRVAAELAIQRLQQELDTLKQTRAGVSARVAENTATTQGCGCAALVLGVILAAPIVNDLINRNKFPINGFSIGWIVLALVLLAIGGIFVMSLFGSKTNPTASLDAQIDEVQRQIAKHRATVQL
jgi:ribosomal protein S27AE